MLMYQVSMTCRVCGAVIPYAVEREADLEGVLATAREICPHCGALMQAEVTGQVHEEQPKPSQVAEPPASYAPLWPFRRVAGSAVGSRCRHWRYRDSVHSPTGLVLEAAFDSFNRAQVFATRWAGRLPRECRGAKVRRRGRFWLVPVPFQPQVGV